MRILAYDRSLRSYDHDGRLRVQMTPISKANICPYYGREIPNAKELGLDMDRVYQMFRDPSELDRAQKTSNGIPLLIKHKAVSPDQPSKDLVVGSTSSDCRFDGTYLKNGLTVWDQEAIDLIESNKQKELSCAYYYRADMIPGQFMGVSYDGVMRDIKFNHVALVENGRAGTDVMVADSLPFKFKLTSNGVAKQMPNAMTSQRALVARGALAAYLRPHLAEDAEIDFNKILLGTTAKTWDKVKPEIIKRVTSQTKGKLTADASLDDLGDVLDMLDDDPIIGQDEWEDDDDEKKAKDKKAAKDKAAKDAKKAKDDGHEPDEEDKEPKDKSNKAEALENESLEKKSKAEDEDDDDDEDDKPTKDRKTAKDNQPVPITKKAMDEALAAQRIQLKAEQKALREAEDIVRPVIGSDLAADSAEEVYELLFKAEKIDVDGVPTQGYKALAQRIVSFVDKAKPAALPAMDAKMAKSYSTDFPEAAAVRHI